uniref:Uncharacterized protein n=1 Tax=Arundo donax TaxID=35708 RepID=A0A0A8YV53_ARUDO
MNQFSILLMYSFHQSIHDCAYCLSLMKISMCY